MTNLSSTPRSKATPGEFMGLPCHRCRAAEREGEGAAGGGAVDLGGGGNGAVGGKRKRDTYGLQLRVRGGVR